MAINIMSLAQAVAIMAPKLGLRQSDRVEVIDFINRTRELVYANYSILKMFDDLEYCLPLQRFCDSCTHPCACQNYYWGFSCPPELSSIRAAWLWDTPIPQRSRWFEAHDGIQRVGDELALVPVNGYFPTMRDFSPGPLRFLASEYADRDSTVRMDGVDLDGNTFKLSIPLTHSTFTTDFGVQKITRLTLPKLVGDLELFDKNEKLVSTYTPGETTPDYRRYKVVIPRCTYPNIRFRADRKYSDVYYDDDLVEIGSRLALEAAATYFRYKDSSDKKEQNVSDRAKIEFFSIMDGLLERTRGHARQDGNILKQHGFKTPTLTGNGKNHRRFPY